MLLDEALPHLPRLRRYARLLTGDSARADDLLQDVLERASRKASLWRPDPAHEDRSASLRAWLLTMMHRLFLNQRRDEHIGSFEEFSDSLAPRHEPHRALEQRMDLERALEALPAAAREVLLLVCVEELSYEETARVLELPVGTVMSRLSRARERMRQLMGSSGAAEGQRAASPPLRVVK